MLRLFTGAQYKVTGVVSFDKHGQPKGFKVQDVAGGKPAGISQEQLDASFANEVRVTFYIN